MKLEVSKYYILNASDSHIYILSKIKDIFKTVYFSGVSNRFWIEVISIDERNVGIFKEENVDKYKIVSDVFTLEFGEH